MDSWRGKRYRLSPWGVPHKMEDPDLLLILSEEKKYFLKAHIFSVHRVHLHWPQWGHMTMPKVRRRMRWIGCLWANQDSDPEHSNSRHMSKITVMLSRKSWKWLLGKLPWSFLERLLSNLGMRQWEWLTWYWLWKSSSKSWTGFVQWIT